MADGIRVTPVSIVPIGGETLVNTTTTDIQQIGASAQQGMATDANGNYIVVWGSNLQDGSGWGIYAQRFSADGTAVGGEFLVSITTADHQLNPAVAMDAAGNFVITWQSNLQDGDSYGVYAQRYDAAGVAQGTEFRVNSTIADYQGSPTIAMDADGDFVIAWVANGQDPDASLGIYAQRFDATGAAQGGEFRVNTYTTGTQQVTSISMDAAGNFVVIWASLNQDGSNYGIFGQRYDASGVAQGAEFQVNTTTANSQLYHDVVMLPDGRFVVEYQSRNADGSFEVFMQRYAADGSAVGGEIRVNTATVSSAQQPIGSITADESGNITVVWNSDADGAGTAVVGQRFDWAGNKLGGELVVNTTTAGNQPYPEVIAQSGGRFIVAWSGNGAGDADGVFMQRYGLATTEGGGSATFQIVLESAPTSDVTIPISVSDASEGTVSVGSVTFNTGNWNIAQTVTVTGVQDFIVDGDQQFQVVFGVASSADTNFNGLDPADLIIINTELPNTAPTTNDVSASGNEDAASIAITLAGSDVDGTVDFFQLSGLPANGTLYTDAGLTTLAATATDYAATAEALTLYFVPNGNWNGNSTFDYVAKDNAGLVDATPATATVTVNAVNDAPTHGAGNITAIWEDDTNPPGETVANLFNPTFTDPDSGAALSGVAITSNTAPGSEGVWEYSTDGGTNWYSIGTASDAASVVFDASTRLRFVPAPDFNGGPTVLLSRVLDNTFVGSFTSGTTVETINTTTNGGTTPISSTLRNVSSVVLPVNDAPTTNNVSATGNEDAASIAITLTGGDLEGNVDNYVLNGLPANGTLYIDAG